MALAREAYKALEDIVGPEYMTEEPVVLDGYCFCWGNEALFGGKFGPRPGAVVLPRSREEIQAMVRVCNRYKIQFKGHGTGFGHGALVGEEGFLSLDLRRMNRILEIDEKNMYALIEPYVSLGALTLEVMKRGLRCHVIGAGPSCSVIANVTSVHGSGVASISAGFGGHNPLSVEWVLPDGEMLRLGSLEAGAGWFTGDGPGPSLRGVLRGFMGAHGAMGIFTKVAVKLSPWYGPPSVESTGRAPSYEVEIPKCFAAYTILFHSRQDLIDAMYLMAEEGIAYALYRRAPYAVTSGMTGSNEELWELWQTGYWQERCQDAMNIVMDSSSPRELEYKEKVFREVVKRFDGEIPPELNEDDVHGQNARFLHAFLGLGAVKGAFRAGGTFHEGITGDDTLDAVQKMVDLALPLKEKLAKEGKLLDDGDCCPIHPYDENTMAGHMETPVRYDPCDPEAVKAASELAAWSLKAGVEANLAISQFEGLESYHDDVHDVAGPKCLHYDEWMRKIKKAFDPNLVAEYTWYAHPK
jgi:glycolate oxidase